jgi:hypothetical protein
VTGGSCYVRTRGSEGLSGVRAEMRQADVNSRLVSKHQHISQKIAFLVSSTSYLIAMSEMDLSLPDTVPDMAQFDNRPMTLDSFALYNLVDTEDEPSGLVQESQSDCPCDDYVRFRKAPGVKSLRSLIDFHLDTTVQDGFDPNFLLVVTDPDWRQARQIRLEDSRFWNTPCKFTNWQHGLVRSKRGLRACWSRRHGRY